MTMGCAGLQLRPSDESLGNYLDIYRQNTDGKRKASEASRLFFSSGGSFVMINKKGPPPSPFSSRLSMNSTNPPLAIRGAVAVVAKHIFESTGNFYSYLHNIIIPFRKSERQTLAQHHHPQQRQKQHHASIHLPLSDVCRIHPHPN